MNPDPRLDDDSVALVVIDVQERLAAAMPEGARERCERNIEILLETARLLEFPVLVTEQYPKGLGHTTPRIAERLDAFEERPTVIEKVDFDAMGEELFDDALDHLATHGREGAIRSIVVVGMEAHVCVHQTVRSLAGVGYSVHVPSDATCSRTAANHTLATQLWQRSGAYVTGTETVLFELLGTAKHPHFKTLSKLIR